MAVAFHDYETRRPGTTAATSGSTPRARSRSRSSLASSARSIAGAAAAVAGARAQPLLQRADGHPFRVQSDRDANSEVHAAIGKTMRVRELAHHMIVTSSNLATNLLLDLVGLESAARPSIELGIEGIDLRRGVEDERACEAGINNRVTADGLVRLLRAHRGAHAFSRAGLRRRCSTSCTSRSSAAASPPALPERRASRTRPARSPPSRTTRASSSCPTASRSSWSCSPSGIRGDRRAQRHHRPHLARRVRAPYVPAEAGWLMSRRFPCRVVDGQRAARRSARRARPGGC